MVPPIKPLNLDMHQFRCLQIIQRPHIINFKAATTIKYRKKRWTMLCMGKKTK